MTTYTTYTLADIENSGDVLRHLTLAAAGRARLEHSECHYRVEALVAERRDSESGRDEFDPVADIDGYYYLTFAKPGSRVFEPTVLVAYARNREEAERLIFEKAAYVDGWRDLRGEVWRDEQFDAMIAEMRAAGETDSLALYGIEE